MPTPGEKKRERGRNEKRRIKRAMVPPIKMRKERLPQMPRKRRIKRQWETQEEEEVKEAAAPKWEPEVKRGEARTRRTIRERHTSSAVRQSEQ